jgi:hypothetical protein
MLNRYSYLGLLDDFAHRHGDTAITTVDDLNEKLILAALFSDPLLINDGYLIMHESVQKALLNPGKSPLKTLIERGFVKILSRNNGGIEQLAKLMAANDITSAQNLLNNHYFIKRYSPFLTRWSDSLNSGAFESMLPWPSIRIDDVYRSVAEATLKTSTIQESIPKADLDEFTRRLSDTKARRTEWENVANEMKNKEQLQARSFTLLMRAANEIYQYAWGCSLLKQLPGVRVLTRIPQHLGILDHAEFELSNKSRKPVEALIPDRTFVIKAVGNKWDSLAAMVTPGHDLNILKHKFLNSLRRYYSNESTSRRLVVTASKNYTEALSKHFGSQTAAKVIFDLTFVAASTGIGLVVPVAGAAASAAVSIVGVGASHSGAPNLLWRLKSPSSGKWLVHKHLAAPEGATSCFQIEPKAAHIHTRHATPFLP